MTAPAPARPDVRPYPENLTLREYAVLIDVSRPTVMRWLDAGVVTRVPNTRWVVIPSAGAPFLPPPGDAYVSPGHAAEILRVGVKTVGKWRLAGRLGAGILLPGGHWRVLRSAVLDLKARREAHR